MMQSMMTTLASVSATQQQPAASQHRAADREEQQPPTKRQETDEPTDHESDKSERACNPTVPAASRMVAGEGDKSSTAPTTPKRQTAGQQHLEPTQQRRRQLLHTGEQTTLAFEQLQREAEPEGDIPTSTSRRTLAEFRSNEACNRSKPSPSKTDGSFFSALVIKGTQK